jgi:hypothetical protein
MTVNNETGSHGSEYGDSSDYSELWDSCGSE